MRCLVTDQYDLQECLDVLQLNKVQLVYKQNLSETSLLGQQMCAYPSCQLALSQHFLMSSHSLFVARGSLHSDDKVNILNLSRVFRGELECVSATGTVCLCMCVCVTVKYVISSHS